MNEEKNKLLSLSPSFTHLQIIKSMTNTAEKNSKFRMKHKLLSKVMPLSQDLFQDSTAY